MFQRKKVRVNGLVQVYRSARGGLKCAANWADVRYETASLEAFHQFGKAFFDTLPSVKISRKKNKFEISKIDNASHEASVRLRIVGLNRFQRERIYYDDALAWASLGFEREAVIVEAIQGQVNGKAKLEVFSSIFGKHWSKALLDIVEENAKKHGFKSVKIRIPESLAYYWNPVGVTGIKTIAKIRRDMRNHYNGLASALGYKRKGIFYIKKL